MLNSSTLKLSHEFFVCPSLKDNLSISSAIYHLVIFDLEIFNPQIENFDVYAKFA
jgi:hypothetical protein